MYLGVSHVSHPKKAEFQRYLILGLFIHKKCHIHMYIFNAEGSNSAW